MSKFSLANASPGKRQAAEESTGGSTSKIPKISHLTKEIPKEKSQKVTTNGPLKMVVYKYSDRAGDLWNQFKDDESTPLYQTVDEINSTIFCHHYKGATPMILPNGDRCKQDPAGTRCPAFRNYQSRCAVQRVPQRAV